MKSKFKLTMVILMLSAMLASASEAEYSRQVRKAWTRNSVTALRIANKFGEVKINDMGGDSVTVKVTIIIDNSSSGRAKELLDMINIKFDKTGGLVSAETVIEENFRGNNSFKIDYLVNIPKDKDLNISNKYGNVVVNELDAKGTFEVSYGSMTAGKMKTPAGSPASIAVNYGKADLESVNNAVMDIKYSKLYADEVGNLVLASKYSTVNLHEIAGLILDSKYDGINIDEIDHLKAGSKYTNYKIGLLTGNMVLDTGYGSVRISKVGEKFDKILITNSYGGINIGLNELNYKLQADCDYCDLAYPTDRFKGNKIRDTHHFTLEGNVGTGGGSVSITSRYGGVKLFE